MSSRKNLIAIFVPALLGGGAERIMVNLAGEISARGYPVDLVVSRAIGPLLNEVSSQVRLVDLKSPRTISSIPTLAGYLRRERPAALLAVLHGNIIALWAHKLARVPTRLIISERNTLSSMSSLESDIRAKIVPFLARLFYPWADGIVAVSKGVADDLAENLNIPAKLLHVLYNPVITPKFLAKVQEPIDHPWFVPGEPPVILAAGRLNKGKDFPTLIRAFEKVVRDCPSRLLILGEGEERAVLEALVKELHLENEVSLPGFVKNPYPYMVRAKMFVLSSVREGLPGVLIEALYCGAPVISTDCKSGPREILADGKYGKLVPVSDVDALAAAIKQALANQYIPASREACEPFTMENTVHRYLEVLLGSQPSSTQPSFTK